jgi:hypothetical protein
MLSNHTADSRVPMPCSCPESIFIMNSWKNWPTMKKVKVKNNATGPFTIQLTVTPSTMISISIKCDADQCFCVSDQKRTVRLANEQVRASHSEIHLIVQARHFNSQKSIGNQIREEVFLDQPAFSVL